MEDDHQITNKMLQEAISTELGKPINDITIESFRISEGSNKGDNYVCIMKAIEVNAKLAGEKESRKFNYMAKCAPINALETQFFTEVCMSIYQFTKQNIAPKHSD